MQLPFWLHGILARGKIFLPVGTAKGSFIDARDIAAVAASLLSRGDLNNRDFDLTGPQALSHDGVAQILSQETGRNIAFEDITPEAMLQGLLAAGLPAWIAALGVFVGLEGVPLLLLALSTLVLFYLYRIPRQVG